MRTRVVGGEGEQGLSLERGEVGRLALPQVQLVDELLPLGVLRPRRAVRLLA